MFKPRGFTLIELLITISIIAILSAIGLVIYSSVLKQGRDSKRQSDLQSIQSALEQYNSDQLFYPSNTTRSMDTLLSTGGLFTSSVGNPVPPSPIKTYLNSIPQDPTGTLRYRYVALPLNCDNDIGSVNMAKCTSYCLYAKLENLSSAAVPAACTADLPVSYNFAVTLP